ncbi:hypothetical protein J6590_039672 [Homalodisca vitripennis]|nr:hypothetical protein J6590_039672 [Homalodisca vitripennis]
MADDNEPEVPVKRRKGVKQVRYKCEVIKEARVKGESYTNWKGNRFERKRKGEDCKYSMKCFEGNIKEINDRFYSFGYRNEQDAYLQSLITVHDIERRRQVSATNPKPRAHSHTYRVSCSTGSYPVCKKAFIAMHGITAMRVRRLYNILSTGKSPVDLRETEDIVEFKKWWKQYYKGVVLSTESYGNTLKERKIKFHVSRFRHFSYYESGTVKAREYIDELDAHTLKLGTGESPH